MYWRNTRGGPLNSTGPASVRCQGGHGCLPGPRDLASAVMSPFGHRAGQATVSSSLQFFGAWPAFVLQALRVTGVFSVRLPVFQSLQ